MRSSSFVSLACIIVRSAHFFPRLFCSRSSVMIVSRSVPCLSVLFGRWRAFVRLTVACHVSFFLDGLGNGRSNTLSQVVQLSPLLVAHIFVFAHGSQIAVIGTQPHLMQVVVLEADTLSAMHRLPLPGHTCGQDLSFGTPVFCSERARGGG